MKYFFIAYLLLINLIAVIITVSDKRKARKKQWRIKESTLLFVSALGGSVSMYLTMLLIRHKTRHLKFMLGIPIITLFQLIFIYLIWRFLNGEAINF